MNNHSHTPSPARRWMLRAGLLLALSIGSVGAGAQQLRVEYFFDSDPGQGHATTVAASADSDGRLQFAAPTDGLTPGYHLLGVRAYHVENGGNRYAPTVLQQVFVPDNTAGYTVSRVEYFWDSDPGYGRGTALAITPGKSVTLTNSPVSTKGLAAGSHRLGVRAYGAHGWSPTVWQTIAVPPEAGTLQTLAAEYFWDNDPGYGHGTPLSITPGQEVSIDGLGLSVEGLTDGEHQLFVRYQGTRGWSPTLCTDIVVRSEENYTIAAAEYFWNEDPGFGKATPIQITPGEEVSLTDINIPSAAAHGDAVLYIRYRGTRGWSPTVAYPVMVDAEGNYTLNAAAATSMEQRNYQTMTDMLDDFTDRGIGNDVTLTVNTLNTDYPLDATGDIRLQQLSQVARNLDERSTARDHATISFTAAEGSGNSVSISCEDSQLPTVAAMLSHTAWENVALTVNGTAYDFTPASQRQQMLCSGDETAAVSLSAIGGGVKATWQAQPHSGTTISGYSAAGEGDLPAMTLVNSGTSIDSLAYHVVLATEGGTQLCDYTYYIYVQALLANQAFSTLQPTTGSSQDPGTVTLRWNAISEALGYRLDISSKPTGDDEATPTEERIDLKTTQYTLTAQAGYTYTWTVTALGYCDNLTSAAQTFCGRQLPDLAVTAITLPEGAVNGQTITVRATVKNQGVGATVENTWTDRLYYVIDSEEYDDALPLGEQSHTGNVAAGESYEAVFTLQIPYVEGSSIRFFVATDTEEKVLETNADNNRTLSGSATLTPFYMNANDLTALRHLFNDFGGQNWNGSRWNTSSELITSSNWSGVTFNTDGRVTAINLQGRGLRGSLTEAKKPTLPLLTTLNLSRNALTGDPSQFVTENGMPQLSVLDLGYNLIDELSAPLPEGIETLTLGYQHRTYNKSTAITGIDQQEALTMAVGTQMSVVMPDIMRYSHASQDFTGHPAIALWNTAMTRRYGNLSWSATNECYVFASLSSYMLNCGQDEDIFVVPTSGAWANSAHAGRIHLTLGDANMTGWVDVNDVQSTLNNIISNTTTKFNRWAANTWSEDDIINIQDIVCTVNIVLANQGESVALAMRRAAAAAANHIYTSGRYVWIEGEETVAAFDLTIEGISSDQVRLMLPAADWQMQARNTENGVRLLVFSPTGETLPTGKQQLLRMSADGQPIAVQASSPDAEDVVVGIDGITTAIDGMLIRQQDGSIYDLQGRKVMNAGDDHAKMKKGIYIMNGKKIMR